MCEHCNHMHYFYRRLLPVAGNTADIADEFGLSSCVYDDVNPSVFPYSNNVTMLCNRVTFTPAGPTVSVPHLL